MSLLEAAKLLAMDAGDYHETQHAISVLQEATHIGSVDMETASDVAMRVLCEALEKTEIQLRETLENNSDLREYVKAYSLDPAKITNSQMAMGNIAMQRYEELRRRFEEVRAANESNKNLAASLKKDKERFDWLEKNAHRVEYHFTLDGSKTSNFCAGVVIRPVIDSAMKASQP